MLHITQSFRNGIFIGCLISFIFIQILSLFSPSYVDSRTQKNYYVKNSRTQELNNSYVDSSLVSNANNQISSLLETPIVYDCKSKDSMFKNWGDKTAPEIGCKHQSWLEWSLNLGKSIKKIYSQSGEDGTTLAIFQKIGTTNKFFLEFGVQDGKVCNSRILRENGWHGRMFDSQHSNDKINLTKTFVWVDNIEALFKKYMIPKDLDYFSLDTNMVDLWHMEKILLLGYRPRVFVVEINPTFRADASVAVARKNAIDHVFWKDDKSYYQHSLLAMTKLMTKFGYNLVTVTAWNPFYILKSAMRNVDLAVLHWNGVLREQPQSSKGRSWGTDGRPFMHICAGDVCESNDDW